MENKIDVKKIAAQNDKFRKTFEGGKVLLTCGVSALPLMHNKRLCKKLEPLIILRKITIRMVNMTLAVLNIVGNKSSGR